MHLKPRPSPYEIHCCQCANPLFAKETSAMGKWFVWCTVCGLQATLRQLDTLGSFSAIPDFSDLQKKDK